jgi:hypothetical protein
MKIRSGRGAKLSHADTETDGQTHMTKLIVAFRNFANAPQKCILVLLCGTRFFCQILMRLEFSQQIFEKSPKYKISRKFFQW